MPTQSNVLTRLRNETAPLHEQVERALDLPDSVQTRADYRELLERLLAFHSAVDVELANERWSDGWAEVGIDLSRHSRADLLRADLGEFGEPISAEPVEVDSPESFGAALGWLYVLEGSSLGGRVLGPAILARFEGIATGFFDSDGRGHPYPWRALQAAVGRYDAIGGDFGELLGGATTLFRSFGASLAPTAWAVAT